MPNMCYYFMHNTYFVLCFVCLCCTGIMNTSAFACMVQSCLLSSDIVFEIKSCLWVDFLSVPFICLNLWTYWEAVVASVLRKSALQILLLKSKYYCRRIHPDKSCVSWASCVAVWEWERKWNVLLSPRFSALWNVLEYFSPCIRRLDGCFVNYCGLWK